VVDISVAFWRFLTICTCFVLAACNGDGPSPPSTPSPPPSSGIERINGSERIGWDQQASTTAELASFRYNIYVDGNPVEMTNVSCADVPASTGFACSARLPSMTPGRHALELSAFIEAGGRLESARSPTLTVDVVTQALTDGGVAPREASLTTVDGARLKATVLSAGLDDAMGLTFAPDGRLFIAERAGRIRIFRDGQVQPAPAALMDDVLATERRGLLAIAVSPDYQATKHVFAVYTTPAGFRVARFRTVGDTLGDRAILLDGVAAPLARPGAFVRFGPDGKLYVGLDDAGDPAQAGDIGSFNGKVLRMNADGTTPPDQAGGTPVYALNVSAPRGFDWGEERTLWIAQETAAGGELWAVVPGGSGTTRGALVARYRLPAGTGPAGATFYRGDLIPELTGNLLVAADEGRSILRLKLDRGAPHRIAASERLLADAFGGVRAIAVGPEGVIYFCTDRALVRLAPEPGP
jgi:glucose/arabinose dehydrogenase